MQHVVCKLFNLKRFPVISPRSLLMHIPHYCCILLLIQAKALKFPSTTCSFKSISQLIYFCKKLGWWYRILLAWSYHGSNRNKKSPEFQSFSFEYKASILFWERRICFYLLNLQCMTFCMSRYVKQHLVSIYGTNRHL